MSHNPFPGPQPYRASDRGRFYGRADMAHALEGTILANRCVTVFGPSGAGKSSIVQAAVVPQLMESYEVRVVRVDGWHEAEDPTSVLATALYTDLGLGDLPEDTSLGKAVISAVQRGARRSTRPMLVYLDQMEQLFYPGRDLAQIDAFFECLNELVSMPLRNVHVVLSLREDYLGRFRDRLREQRRILDHGFRVGPMTVSELTDAVCQAAAAGDPPQQWAQKQMRLLMLQVRVPGQVESDDAEAQSAYAQIVCRALFQQREQGESNGEAVEAEPILRHYIESTLEGLDDLKSKAQRLLEDHLVTADGSRTLRTEKELLRVLPQEELQPCLKALEGAAILHAEEHHGSRYFEIGHDWLAKWVFEQRETRRQAEEKAKADQKHLEELQKQQEKARKSRNVAVAALVAMAVVVLIGIWAWNQKVDADKARQEAETQEGIARKESVEANDAKIMAVVFKILIEGRPSWASRLLSEVKLPANRRGWVYLANETLREHFPRATLIGHDGSLSTAVFSPDGKRVLTASFDRTARLWNTDGMGQPVILSGHEGAIAFAVFSPDGKHVLTTSDDDTARVWNADGTGQPVVLTGHHDDVVFGAFSPDGKRVVTASEDGVARVFQADGSGAAIELRGPANPKHPNKQPFTLRYAIFHPDGNRVFTASEDGSVRLWQLDTKPKFEELKGHSDRIEFMGISPDGHYMVTTSRDDTARLWDVNTKASIAVLKGHTRDVHHAAFSPDGTRLATASGDGTVRLWNVKDGKPIVDDKGQAIILKNYFGAMRYVSFSPDGKFIAYASNGKGIVEGYFIGISYTDGVGKSLILRGHDAPVGSVAWSPDGSLLLTAALDATDHSAKLWSTERVKSLPHNHNVYDKKRFYAASFSADNKFFVSADDDKIARLWRIDDSEPPVEFKVEDQDIRWLASATISPAGDRVVTASFDNKARIYRVDGTGEPIVLSGHDAEVRYAAFSPDGTRVVTVADDNKARIFAADGTGSPKILEGHGDWLTWAAWSPDSKRIVTTSLDDTVRVWDAVGSQPPIVLEGHEGDIYMAAFSPDGKRVVTASEDKTARIWNADGTGTPTKLEGHDAPVLHAVFSPDGHRLATHCKDGSIYAWNLDSNIKPTDKPIVIDTLKLFVGDPDPAMTFTEDGKHILTVRTDGTVTDWLIDIEDLSELLKTATVDCLPVKPRIDYLGESPEDAKKNFDECEAKYGRTPVQTKVEPIADNLDPGMRRVKIVVLPEQAEVEVDGSPARLRNGVVELVSKDGVHGVRVSKGPDTILKQVQVTDKGADPWIIDLNAEKLKANGADAP